MTTITLTAKTPAEQRDQILREAIGDDKPPAVYKLEQWVRWHVSDPDVEGEILNTLTTAEITEVIMDRVEHDWRRGAYMHSFKDADIIWPYVWEAAQRIGVVTEDDLAEMEALRAQDEHEAGREAEWDAYENWRED